MRKKLILILVTLMCFFLGACGSKDEEHLIGEWKFDNGYSVIFNEDNTGVIIEEKEYEFNWSYDKSDITVYCEMLSGNKEEMRFFFEKNGGETRNLLFSLEWECEGTKN